MAECPTRKPANLRYYPERAQRAGVTGAAELLCKLNPSGSIAGCGVLSETSGGYGFGEAASKLTCLIKPVSDETRVGDLIVVPMKFNLP
jgi:protein TonB